MTIIKITKGCLEQFKKDFEKGLFSDEDGVVLKIWASEMEQYGSKYIMGSSKWRDHPLDRQWFGYRASCFSHRGRIIYKIINEHTIEVCEVKRVTADHNYKK